MSEATENHQKDAAALGFTARKRLTHAERCGALFALYSHFPQAVVAIAFEFAPTNAHALAQCLNPNAPKRYREVTAEWRELGPEEFGERYFTSEMREKCLAAGTHYRAAQIEKARLKNPDQNRAELEGWHIVASRRGPQLYQIEADPELRGEWIWKHVIGLDGPTPLFATHIDSLMPDDRYRSARQALIAIYQKNGERIPRVFPPALSNDEAEIWATEKWPQNKSTNQS
jgi:hypothetical protein